MRIEEDLSLLPPDRLGGYRPSQACRIESCPPGRLVNHHRGRTCSVWWNSCIVQHHHLSPVFHIMEQQSKVQMCQFYPYPSPCSTLWNTQPFVCLSVNNLTPFPLSSAAQYDAICIAPMCKNGLLGNLWVALPNNNPLKLLAIQNLLGLEPQQLSTWNHYIKSGFVSDSWVV